MHIVIITMQGFNELDSLIALGVLNRIKRAGWRVTRCCPEPEVTSMNEVTVHAQSTLEEATSAQAVTVGSGLYTRDIVRDRLLMARLVLDPQRQLIAGPCSGTLILAKPGLLGHVPACTDVTTTPWIQEAGVEVLHQSFFASGNWATAGGCLASSYLAAWIIASSEGVQVAREALHYVAPVAEKKAFVSNALSRIQPYLPRPPAAVIPVPMQTVGVA